MTIWFRVPIKKGDKALFRPMSESKEMLILLCKHTKEKRKNKSENAFHSNSYSKLQRTRQTKVLIFFRLFLIIDDKSNQLVRDHLVHLVRDHLVGSQHVFAAS